MKAAKPARFTPVGPYWRARQAAEWADIAVGVLYRWNREGRLPCPDVVVRLGGKERGPLRFKIQPFKDWCDGGDFTRAAAEKDKRK